MVGGDVAGSSRRCDECKRRRKKCDLQEPQCLRCRQSGIRCSGPKDSTIFIHSRPSSIFRHNSRLKLVQAHQSRSAENGRSQRFYKLSVKQLQAERSVLIRHEYESSLPSDENVLSGRLALWEPLYQAIVQEFTNTSDSSIFSGDRNTRKGTKHYSAMALTIRALLPFACKYIPALDMAIFSLLAMYYGRLHANAGLVKLARSSYTATLSEFLRLLPKVTATSAGNSYIGHALCRTSIALCCLEHLDEIGTSGVGYAAHFDGALQLLQSCGSAMVQDLPGSRLLLKGFRSTAVHISVQRRQPTFLSEHEWNQQMFDTADSTVQDRLVTMALEVPGILELVDDFHASTSTSSGSSESATALLERIHSLKARFHSWLTELDASVEGDLYWVSGQRGFETPRSVDTECQPKVRSSHQQLDFATGTIAGLLAHYWSFELNLLTAESLVQTSVQTKNSTGSVVDTSARADKTAQYILEAQPYLTSCLEGTICMQLVMGTAKRYFAHAND